MPEPAQGACLCGEIAFEMAIPAVWAWHDHTARTRHAHGAAYANYVGTWRSRLRITQGEDNLAHFTDPANGHTRSFCQTCGTPVFYARAHAPKMVNIPRALFTTRTGREPRYHLGIEDTPDWAYAGEKTSPLKGYPGYTRHRPKK